MEHALVLNGAVLRYAELAAPLTLAPNKGVWLPVVVATDPSFDPVIETLSDPADTVHVDHVARARSVVAKSLATVKAEKLAAVTARSAEAFSAGYTVPSGTLAGETLQCRDNTDRTNWQTSAISYGAAIAAGQGAVTGALFRTASNTNFTLSFNEGYQVIVLGMAGWGKAIYENLWNIKDAIEAASTVAEVVAIDVTAGW